MLQGRIMKKIIDKTKSKKGFSLIELVVVATVIIILAAVTAPMIMRMRYHKTVAEGILRVYELKKGFDEIARECGGYPIRSAGGSYTNLLRIMNRCPATFPNCNLTYPNGLPEIHPTGRECDSVSLQEYIPSDLTQTTCDVTDPDCKHTIMSGTGNDFTRLFVGDSGGIADDCSVASGGTITGWNYALIASTTDPALRPVPVVCANIVYKGDSVTVVLNGGGDDGVHRINDGSGMLSPTGTPLANACTCGPWCSNNYSGESGCCDDCTDDTGTRIQGIGFKF